ncbi:hypothetical protein TYRP_005261 [Tyrophagus putrescentiae]|nr:hypothetical protein TYRP_005261 [Tyrophagus putrescentiae]
MCKTEEELKMGLFRQSIDWDVILMIGIADGSTGTQLASSLCPEPSGDNQQLTPAFNIGGGEFWSHQKAYDRRAARVSGSSSRVNDKGGEFQSHWKAYDRRAARKSQSNRFSAEVVLAPRELQWIKGGGFWSHQKAYDRRAARVSGSSSRDDVKGGEFWSHQKAYDRRAARVSDLSSRVKGGEFWSHQKAYDRRAARVSGSSSSPLLRKLTAAIEAMVSKEAHSQKW